MSFLMEICCLHRQCLHHPHHHPNRIHRQIHQPVRQHRPHQHSSYCRNTQRSPGCPALNNWLLCLFFGCHRRFLFAQCCCWCLDGKGGACCAAGQFAGIEAATKEEGGRCRYSCRPGNLRGGFSLHEHGGDDA